MNDLRYFLAAFLVIGVPSVWVFWWVIHPFVRFWRRVGPVVTYSVVVALMGATMVGLYHVHRPLMAIEFGASYLLSGLGLVCLLGATVLFAKVKKHLTMRIQSGLQELAPDGTPGTLLTEGVYARIRHPRYTELMLALAGYSFVANYLAGYVVVVLCVPMFHLVAVLEERELRARFGDTYTAYCRRVPRFLPRRRP